jgi:hypothetical protein
MWSIPGGLPNRPGAHWSHRWPSRRAWNTNNLAVPSPRVTPSATVHHAIQLAAAGANALAVVTMFSARSFDAEGNIRNYAHELYRQIGAVLAPDDVMLVAMPTVHASTTSVSARPT